jgi:hypothetical protein
MVTKAESKAMDIPDVLAGTPDRPVNEELKKDAAGRLIVTRKAKVDAVKYLSGIPSHWPVPTIETAYVLDFSDDARVSDPSKTSTAMGKLKGLDAFLKAEVCDAVFTIMHNRLTQTLIVALAGSGLLGKRNKQKHLSGSEAYALGQSSCTTFCT